MAIILIGAQRERWEEARATGSYLPDDFEQEGFIHASTPDQIVAVANKHYQGRPCLVLLYVDTERLYAHVRYEGKPGGKQYPHIYGPLNANAVLRVVDYAPDSTGRFTLPPDLE